MALVGNFYEVGPTEIHVEKARIDSRGRLVIPKRMREKLKLREGEEVLIIPEKDGLLIKKQKIRGNIGEAFR